MGAILTEGGSRLPRRCSQVGPCVENDFPKPPFFLPSGRRDARQEAHLPAAKSAILPSLEKRIFPSPSLQGKRKRRGEGGPGQRIRIPSESSETKPLRKGDRALRKPAERRREGKAVAPSARAPGILGPWLSSPRKTPRPRPAPAPSSCWPASPLDCPAGRPAVPKTASESAPPGPPGLWTPGAMRPFGSSRRAGPLKLQSLARATPRRSKGPLPLPGLRGREPEAERGGKGGGGGLGVLESASSHRSGRRLPAPQLSSPPPPALTFLPRGRGGDRKGQPGCGRFGGLGRRGWCLSFGALPSLPREGLA